ncbi:transferase family-domain-containing protein [Xylariomycetidae sp. FL2044]|nr:transferase family-domain-containing protein [Xylariomycetidae sp. FL2044]
MASQEIRILPTGWQNAPEEEKFILSDMDHTMPKIYCQIAEIFELPKDADKHAIVSNLSKGLEFTIGQFPILAGALHMDATNGRLWVTKKKDASVGLFVKHMDGEDSDFPSFEYLDQHDFPVHLLDGHKLLPKAVTEKQLFSPLGDNADEDTIIATFQVNFIRGGVILGMALHHSCSDGPGCNGFLTTWAENSAAATRGAPFQPIDPANLDRTRLSAPKPDAARWKELDGKFVILKDAGGPPPPPPAGFKMPDMKIRTWHFPQSSLARLKADSTPAAGEGGWVSTYDSVISLAWKCTTRAKIPLLRPGADAESVVVHAVNTRARLSPPLPDRYLGNAVALPRAEPIRVSELAAEGGLARTAGAVRASINTITDEYVAGLPAWVAGLEDRRWINIDMSSFLGLDLACTSWQAMTPYEDHDFGFGLPRAMRWPHPQFEGYVFVLPSRAAVKPASADEGIEIIVCLEAGCHDRLLRDPEMLKYAQPRGADV